MRIRRLLSIGACTTMLAVVLICGCSPPAVSVKSNLSAGYSADAEKIFVVLDTRELDGRTEAIRFEYAEFGMGEPDTLCFGINFLNELALNFEAIGVQCGFYRMTSVETNEEDCARLAKRFGADEVVWIKEDFIGITRNAGTWALVPYEEVTELTLDARILGDTKESALNWRASINAKKGTGDWSAMAQASASRLVDKLVADGLINGGGFHQQ